METTAMEQQEWNRDPYMDTEFTEEVGGKSLLSNKTLQMVAVGVGSAAVGAVTMWLIDRRNRKALLESLKLGLDSIFHRNDDAAFAAGTHIPNGKKLHDTTAYVFENVVGLKTVVLGHISNMKGVGKKEREEWKSIMEGLIALGARAYEKEKLKDVPTEYLKR